MNVTDMTYSCIILCIMSTLSLSTSTEITCDEDQVMDLNGKCVKKFILPKRKKCPSPDIKFGGFEISLGGRMVSFWCEDGWTLATPEPGYSHAMCKLGEWDRPIPNCVRPGCEKLETPQDSVVILELDGAIARFRCPGKDLVGDSVLSCDGQFWNGTEPTCVAFTTTTTPPPETRLDIVGASQTSRLLPSNFSLLSQTLFLMLITLQCSR